MVDGEMFSISIRKYGLKTLKTDTFHPVELIALLRHFDTIDTMRLQLLVC